MIKISDEILDSLISDIELMSFLKKLSNKDLIQLAINKYSDYTTHPIVEEMMDRLDPGWEGKNEDDGTLYDTENSR